VCGSYNVAVVRYNKSCAAIKKLAGRVGHLQIHNRTCIISENIASCGGEEGSGRQAKHCRQNEPRLLSPLLYNEVTVQLISAWYIFAANMTSHIERCCQKLPFRDYALMSVRRLVSANYANRVGSSDFLEECNMP
jgi:hypothetical protein